MSNENIIRAWKDENFRNSLSEQERALLPENPAGMSELSDEALQTIAGGMMAGGGGTGCGTGTNCTNCDPCSGDINNKTKRTPIC